MPGRELRAERVLQLGDVDRPPGDACLGVGGPADEAHLDEVHLGEVLKEARDHVRRQGKTPVLDPGASLALTEDVCRRQGFTPKDGQPTVFVG